MALTISPSFEKSVCIFRQFISPSILKLDIGSNSWRRTSQIPSHFNPNVWLCRHGSPSQFNPSLGYGLIPNVLTANQQLSLTQIKKYINQSNGGLRLSLKESTKTVHSFQEKEAQQKILKSSALQKAEVLLLTTCFSIIPTGDWCKNQSTHLCDEFSYLSMCFQSPHCQSHLPRYEIYFVVYKEFTRSSADL